MGRPTKAGPDLNQTRGDKLSHLVPEIGAADSAPDIRRMPLNEMGPQVIPGFDPGPNVVPRGEPYSVAKACVNCGVALMARSSDESPQHADCVKGK